MVIQGKLLLGPNGLAPGFKENRNVRINELLDRIQRYATQQRSMQWTKQMIVPYRPSGLADDNKMFLSGDYLVFIRDDSTSIEVTRLPSLLRGVTEDKWVLHPGLIISELVVEASQDLLVLVQKNSA